jgi:two-component system response regulator DctR
VLLDVRMPGMNGIAVFDQLVARGLLARLPVIFLTGHGDVPMAVDSLKRGAFDFFEKPFNDNQLMDRVEEALALAPGRRSGARCRRAWHAVGARTRSARPDPGRAR